MVMMDLSASMFYKIKFNIQAKEADEDLLWKIVLHLKRWLVKKWNKDGIIVLETNNHKWTGIKNGGRLFTDSNEVYIESEFFSPDAGNTQFWACRITESPIPSPLVAPRKWITEIGFEYGEENPAIFSCVVSYVDRAGFIGPYQSTPSPSVPNLIRNIISDPTLTVFSGDDELSDHPVELHTGDWPKFEKRIDSAKRNLPYIYISPRRIGPEAKDTELLVDPDRLSIAVFGNARVFFSTDANFAGEMKYLKPDYACYNGAIRVYQPKVKDAFQHHYFGVEDVEQFGEKGIIEFLNRAFSQNVNFYDSFFRIDNCRQKKLEYERSIRIAELRSQANQADESIILALEEEEKRIEAESLADDYLNQLDAARDRIYTLESTVQGLISAGNENATLRQAVNARMNVMTLPSSAEEIANYFSEVFADKIIITERAYRSLKQCTLPLDELWKVFFALANTMLDLYINGSGDIFDEFKHRTGIDCARGEGTMTRKDNQLMRQFETIVDGEAVDIEAHITYGKLGQSIHFGYSNAHKKVVVGHCGEHLKIYSTKKVK